MLLLLHPVDGTGVHSAAVAHPDLAHSVAVVPPEPAPGVGVEQFAEYTGDLHELQPVLAGLTGCGRHGLG